MTDPKLRIAAQTDDELTAEIAATNPSIARVLAEKDHEIARIRRVADEVTELLNAATPKRAARELWRNLAWAFVAAVFIGSFALCAAVIRRFCDHGLTAGEAVPLVALGVAGVVVSGFVALASGDES